MAGHVLGEHIDWIVELKCVIIGDVVQFCPLRADDLVVCAFNLEAARPAYRKVAFDDDGFAIDVRLEGRNALVLNFNPKYTVPNVFSG